MYPLKSHASKSRTKGVREMAKGRGKKLVFFRTWSYILRGSIFLKQKVTKKSKMYVRLGRGREGVNGLGLSPKFFVFSRWLWSFGSWAPSLPCPWWSSTKCMYVSTDHHRCEQEFVLFILQGRQPWLWKLSGFLQPSRTRLVPGEI